jgi:colanic acid/amylovoran biosynthesis glycosyltransferase
LSLAEFKYSPLPCPKKNEQLRLLTVGRFHKDKGHRYALLAAARLVRAGINVQYRIVGVGPEKERLQKMIIRLGLPDRVGLFENLSDVELRPFYIDTHIFILPSIDNKYGEPVETQGVVLQEAQASGCIPVATRVGGIPECVHDKEDAVLVKDKSSEAIFDAICYLLKRPDEWSAFHENGRRNVEIHFSSDVIGKKLALILRELAEPESLNI